LPSGEGKPKKELGNAKRVVEKTGSDALSSRRIEHKLHEYPNGYMRAESHE
jgi:hypothetical protein